MSKQLEKVVIVGSGPAGWTAAIYAARANLTPLVIEGAFTQQNHQQGLIPLGQLALTTEIENFPGFPAGDTRNYLKTALPEESQPHWVSATKSPPIPQPTHGINGPELMELMRQQAKNFGTRIVTEDVVKVNLKTKPFELYLSDGQSVKALSVIIATGARANYLGLPSEDKFKTRGVSACAVCDGALPRYKNKPVVVIGGGDSAVEEASYLAKFTSEVALVVRRDVLRASKIMADRAKNNAKIKMRWNSVIDEVLGNDKDGVTAVRIKDVKSGKVDDYAAAGMFCAIGHTPNTAFLDGQIELNEKSYIKWTTPARTFTSVEGVFAAGDVADDYYRQAVTAAGTGCMAALDAERYLSHHGLI